MFVQCTQIWKEAQASELVLLSLSLRSTVASFTLNVFLSADCANLLQVVSICFRNAIGYIGCNYKL
jgi:hypothetical protein